MMFRILLALWLFWAMLAQAQLVTVPIPGAPGLNVTVGVGANALPLRDIRSSPGAVNITTGDDSWNNVPLGFNFPFFGQTFTNSWAMTNGAITFRDPQITGAGGLCCEGVNLTTSRDPRFNYSIFPLWTDLYSWNGQNQWYLRENNNTMTYGWYNLSQCCSSQGGNSFEVKINSSGLVDTRIAGALVSRNRVTSGMTGDLAQGQYYQYYHGQGISIPAGSANIFSWQALAGTGGVDPCVTNPLSSPTCSGYAAAYLTQQCTISALYDPTCPGYQQAYFTYQCSINPLYSELCPGYARAYYNQQCSLNPLYDSGCPGYAQAYYNQQCSLNPLYDSGCPGYAQAYLTQQCTANPLYNTQCPGYAQAYFTQQCTANPLYDAKCPGYAQAYFTQQCTANPLYNTQCPGYAQAYFTQQCTANPLYNTQCPGYAQAYYNQQCSLNGLYDRNCPNYATTYATKMLLDKQPVTNTTTAVMTTTATTTTEPVTASSVTQVSTTGNSTVDKAITPTTTTAITASAPAAAVQLTQPATNANPASPSSVVSAGTSNQPTAPQPQQTQSQPTTRAQQLQQARQEAARKEAAARGGENMKEAREAKSMEQQVAVQNQIIGAMSYNPGFDVYNSLILRDRGFYPSVQIYPNSRTIDNTRLLRGLTGASERRFDQMIEQQY